jgi:hypothetical protein
MTTVTIAFNLPEDEVDLSHAMKSTDYYSTIWEVCNTIRTQLKHGDESKDRETLEKVRIELLVHIE